MGPGAKLIPKLVAQIVFMLVFFGAILFAAAGTWNWPSAWAFLALFGVLTVAVSLWLAVADAGLLAERMKPPIQAGQEPWDRAFMGLVGVAYVGWLALMGLDARRAGWSHVPPAVQVAGGVLLVLGFAGVAWVFRTNSFAAPVIKIQAERHQTVISTGPYTVVRHPMYAFGLLQFIGVPLVLGSWWGLTSIPPIVLALAYRTLGEERMLKADLAGYEDYTLRVRWRFAPGVW